MVAFANWLSKVWSGIQQELTINPGWPVLFGLLVLSILFLAIGREVPVGLPVV
jgi:hypothetical protein